MGRIKPLSPKSKQPRRLLFIDCATDLEVDPHDETRADRKFRLAVGTRWLWVGDEPTPANARAEVLRVGPYSCRERVVLRSPFDLCSWIESSTSSRYPTWVFAHRMAHDAMIGGMLDQIKNRKWRFMVREKETPNDLDAIEFAESSPGLQVISDPPTILSVKVANGNQLLLTDTMNYWPVSLDELARSVGLQREPEPGELGNDSDWISHCKREVEIIEQAVMKLVDWLDQYEWGALKFTAAGQAMSVYRTAFMKRDLEAHEDIKIREVERLALFGGETRAFQVGFIDEWVCQLDVNSLYPFVMKETRCPYDIHECQLQRPWSKSTPCVDPHNSMVHCWLYQWHDAYPMRIGNQVEYARGSFHTWLTGPEYVDALSLGHVIGTAGFVEYKTDYLFSDYVDTFYARKLAAKKRGDRVSEIFAKSMLNNLSGKFGQRGVDIIPRTDIYAPCEWGTWITVSTTTRKRREFKVLNSMPWEVTERKELPNGMPAITAWITGAGRVMMKLRREIAGCFNCIYQATDSLIVNRAGFDRLDRAGLIDSEKLGLFRKLVESSTAIIRGYGSYAIANREVETGIKERATHLGGRSWQFSVAEGLRESLFKPPSGMIEERIRVVRIPPITARGVIDSQGIVRPVAVDWPLPPALGG